MIAHRSTRCFLAGVVLLRVLGVAVVGQQSTTTYTTEQVDAGRAAYEATCANCHQPDLTGRNQAPPLAGPAFTNVWGIRTTRELLDVIQSSMPPDGPGLDVDSSVAIVAYILQANGASAGMRALTPEMALPIGTVATNQIGTAPRRNAQPAPAETPQVAAPDPTPTLTVTGEVDNYVPVTDAMLRNPDPEDWLMIRGNYQGWSYSPLTTITRDNVGDLRLAWVWAMYESGGASQPSPLVHNGIIYLLNPGNIVQALDGRTGELIWENHTGAPDGGAGTTRARRNLSIYAG